MAKMTYIDDDFSALAAAMQSAVNSGYFSSVEYIEGTEEGSYQYDTVECYDENENVVFSISKTDTKGTYTIRLRFDDGSLKTSTMNIGRTASQYTSVIGYVYDCGSTIYLQGYGASSQTSLTAANQSGFLLLSRTNNNKIGVVFTTTSGSNSSDVSGHFESIQSWATDDDIKTADNLYSFSSREMSNQGTLYNIQTSAGLSNAPSYFPDIFNTKTSPFYYSGNATTPPYGVIIDETKYLWIGGYLIKDK